MMWKKEFKLKIILNHYIIMSWKCRKVDNDCVLFQQKRYIDVKYHFTHFLNQSGLGIVIVIEGKF